jgi:hypothetical protein
MKESISRVVVSMIKEEMRQKGKRGESTRKD